jgi:EAL domain-containing protein (putative c-di-GMP-specific phosphodiesterase class I)
MSTTLFAIVRITNRAPVIAAYGRDAADKLIATVRNRAAGFLGGRGLVVAKGQDSFNLLIRDPLFLHAVSCLDACGGSCILEMLLQSLGQEPVEFEDAQILPTLTLAIERLDRGAGEIGDAKLEARDGELSRRIAAAAPHCPDVGSDAFSRGRYRMDMWLAAWLGRAMREDRLFLAWQPVMSGPGESRILYHEGLLRVAQDDGQLLQPYQILPSLERTGLVRSLDRHVVSMVLDRLRADPDVHLGCNISAQSAIVDGWWAAIFAELEEEPDLAARLVVEITESATLPGLSLVVDFANRLRRLGCRIAIDDFGAGRSSIRQLPALEPDIVKIGAFFPRRVGGRLDGPEYEGFVHLVGLAKSFAPIVVVDGIEDYSTLEVARSVGADGVQGFHFGVPSWSGPGLARADGLSGQVERPVRELSRAFVAYRAALPRPDLPLSRLA